MPSSFFVSSKAFSKHEIELIKQCLWTVAPTGIGSDQCSPFSLSANPTLRFFFSTPLASPCCYFVKCCQDILVYICSHLLYCRQMLPMSGDVKTGQVHQQSSLGAELSDLLTILLAAIVHVSAHVQLALFTLYVVIHRYAHACTISNEGSDVCTLHAVTQVGWVSSPVLLHSTHHSLFTSCMILKNIDRTITKPCYFHQKYIQWTFFNSPTPCIRAITFGFTILFQKELPHAQCFPFKRQELWGLSACYGFSDSSSS